VRSRASPKRLGQWLDWGADYFTFSDTNNRYIWRFLKTLHDRGWLYLGHRAPRCPRSEPPLGAELTTTPTATRSNPRSSASLTERPGEALASGRRSLELRPRGGGRSIPSCLRQGAGRGVLWLAAATEQVPVRARSYTPGEKLVGWRYTGPSPPSRRRAGRVPVVAGTRVDGRRATGQSSNRAGCGGEASSWASGGLPVLGDRRDGVILPGYGWLTGQGAHERADEIIADW